MDGSGIRRRSCQQRGASIADLMRAPGKGRTWVYERLRQLADAGRVIQTIRGHWRAALPPR